ncbi:hypothetical protein SGLAM104S_03310 [Streptomyces glaucescens]
MVTLLSPAALASASRSASSEPSLSWADLAPGSAAAGAAGSAAKAMGIGPAAESAATRPAATAMRATRLAPGIGSLWGVWVIGIPCR